MIELFLVIGLSFLGALLGCLSGLVPGLHVNNLALILVSLSPSLLFLLPNPLLVCLIIVTISIAHTFVNLIPGTFLGAPDENALGILPAHKLLLEGNGYSAVFISSVGSFGALAFGFVTLLLFKFIMCELNFYLLLTRFMAFILIAITIILIYSEHREIPYKKGIAVENIKYRERSGKADFFKKLKLKTQCSLDGLITRSNKGYFIETKNEQIPLSTANIKLIDGVTATVEGIVKRVKAKFSRTLGVVVASFVFLLSGALGIIIFSINVSSPLNLPSTVLFPAFAGLFGLPTLIFSARSISAIPKQRLIKPHLDKKASFISVLTGSAAGSVVGFLPGVTSGHATVLSMLARSSKPLSFLKGKREKIEVSPEQTLLTLSAVNTSYSFFCVVTLFVLGKARNGTAFAVAQLTNIEKWTSALPVTFIYLLIGILIAGAVSYYVNIWLGKCFVKIFSHLPYRKLVISIVAFIAIMVFIFTGLVGLLILFVATAVGLIPLLFGVRRSHCMGLILLPTIIRL
ncbi:MAG: tripartite tricarboxylate transporter permease [Candidatus Thermoplasmatota archaeon]|nr:tripartite tricarboxylate transporter permease [Candidatus Thermoplasmatota archaeon]